MRANLRAVPRARGFTLIELVAAFVIFAIGFGVLLQILSTCLHTTAQATDYTRVALWAQSLLDTQGVGEPLQEGSSNGRFDERYSWELNVTKIQAADDPGIAPTAGNTKVPGVQITQVGPPAMDLYQLELVVSWASYYLTHHARFVTLRAQNPGVNGGLPGQPGLPQPQAQPVRSRR